MTAILDARLMRLLGGDALAPLRKRLRQRYERAAEPGGLARLRIARLSAEEHAALAALSGRSARYTGSLQIDLQAVDASLRRAGIAASLREALELLDGPILHLATTRRETLAAWASVVQRCDHAGLTALLATPLGLGLLKRLARQDAAAATTVCEQAQAVLQRLPAGGMLRAQLAAQTLGDAHALDDGRPVAALVLAVLRRGSSSRFDDDAATDAETATATATAKETATVTETETAMAKETATVTETETETATEMAKETATEIALRATACTITGLAGDGAAGPAPLSSVTVAEAAAVTEERSRDLWAAAGVLVNELARPALHLNLPVARGEPAIAGGPPDIAPPTGEPAYVSLRALLRSPPRWQVAGRTIYICENPNLLAIAADHWGAACAPLVCTDGMPAAAQRCLLAQLAAAGADLRYHGDFDWAGLQIGNVVMREHGARPWRFGAVEYEAAARLAHRPGHALAPKSIVATWDAALAPAMARHGIAIAEEGLAATLLGDLETPGQLRDQGL